jgi:hypothetical protein
MVEFYTFSKSIVSNCAGICQLLADAMQLNTLQISPQITILIGIGILKIEKSGPHQVNIVFVLIS